MLDHPLWQSFEPELHLADPSMLKIPHGHLHHPQKGTSFFMSMVGNAMGGAGGGMLGAGAGAAGGTMLAFYGCKRAKGCTQKCMAAPPDCTGCLEMCAKISAAGAAAGGAGGSALGQKMMPGTANNAAPAATAAAAPPPGGGMLSILDEWNTAPVFALMHKQGFAGVDASAARRDRRSRHTDFFDVDAKIVMEGKVNT